MEGFFAKYNVVLDEWNCVDKIVETAKRAARVYDEKNEAKYLKKLAYLHSMLEDFFEAKGEDLAAFKKAV